MRNDLTNIDKTEVLAMGDDLTLRPRHPDRERERRTGERGTLDWGIYYLLHLDTRAASSSLGVLLCLCVMGFIVVSFATQQHLDDTFLDRMRPIARKSVRVTDHPSRASSLGTAVQTPAPSAATFAPTMATPVPTSVPPNVSWITECGCTGMQVGEADFSSHVANLAR